MENIITSTGTTCIGAFRPHSMAQGILTGMGFLGVGLVIKENLSNRGLTTAAIMWLVTAEGVLIGIGFYMPAFLGLGVTLFILIAHEQFESFIPTRYYAVLKINIAHKMSDKKDTDIIEIEQQLLNNNEKFSAKKMVLLLMILPINTNLQLRFTPPPIKILPYL